jgi:threonine/homoserine/homoserine lactone efflux protein
MESPLVFVASATALLLVPGPTNSLIATNGAISGLRRTVLLLPAELLGYMVAIVGWGLGLAAVANSVPSAVVIAKLVASGMLVLSAWNLWIFGGKAGQRRSSRMADIFLVTISNPKALVFALTIVPYLKDGNLNPALPYLGLLAILILAIGICWSAAGVGLAYGLSSVFSTASFARVGAMVLLGFATALVGTALSASPHELSHPLADVPLASATPWRN